MFLFTRHIRRETDDGWRARRNAAEAREAGMEFSLRPVPHQMADPELVTVESCNAPEWVRLIANDLDGTRQATLEIRRDDLTSIGWFVKVLRHWLAWRHFAIRLKILKSG